MRTLTVLFDERCAFCRRCAHWLRLQTTYFPLRTIPAGGEVARRLYPGLTRNPLEAELIAVDDLGGVYRDTDAWLICLYAVEQLRPWAMRLATPGLRPVARQLFETISSQRGLLSSLWGLDDEALARELAGSGANSADACGDAACPR